MAKVVAFSVPSIADGEKALDELERVDDVATAHRIAAKLRKLANLKQ